MFFLSFSVFVKEIQVLIPKDALISMMKLWKTLPAIIAYNGQWISQNTVMQSKNGSNTWHVYIWMCVWEEFTTEGKYLTWSASASFLHGDALIWLFFHWLELIRIRSRVFQTLRARSTTAFGLKYHLSSVHTLYTVISLTTVHRFNFRGFSPSSASPFEPSLFLFLDNRAEPWASIQALILWRKQQELW